MQALSTDVLVCAVEVELVVGVGVVVFSETRSVRIDLQCREHPSHRLRLFIRHVISVHGLPNHIFPDSHAWTVFQGLS